MHLRQTVQELLQQLNVLDWVVVHCRAEHLVVVKLPQILVLWVLALKVVKELLEFIDVSLDLVLLDDGDFFNLVEATLNQVALWLDAHNELVVVVLHLRLEFNCQLDIRVVKLSVACTPWVVRTLPLSFEGTEPLADKGDSLFLVDFKLNSTSWA